MWIKICGINDLENARQIARLRPDAIGLNFYSGSVRAVAPETARQIAGALPPDVRAIGIFVEAWPRRSVKRVQSAASTGSNCTPPA